MYTRSRMNLSSDIHYTTSTRCAYFPFSNLHSSYSPHTGSPSPLPVAEVEGGWEDKVQWMQLSFEIRGICCDGRVRDGCKVGKPVQEQCCFKKSTYADFDLQPEPSVQILHSDEQYKHRSPSEIIGNIHPRTTSVEIRKKETPFLDGSY